MTHISKVTKAELLAENAEYGYALATVSEERDELVRQIKAIPKPARVPEADALAGCIRALDGLPTSTRDGYNFGVIKDAPDRATIRRILTHLADQYGVTLIETRTEPCSRPHVDQVDPSLVLDALQRGQVVLR